MELLIEGAKYFGLEPDKVAVDRFALYMHELQRWGKAINLTAIKKPDEIIIKHFVDSMSIVPLLKTGEKILDVGSGAGMPGLVIAILRDDLHVTSIDAVDKKARFQRHIARLLGLANVEVLHGRVEQLAEDVGADFDCVTSRAFSDLTRFAQLAGGLVRVGGRLIAMTAGRFDRASAQSLASQGLEHQQTNRYKLPLEMGNRNLEVFLRISATDKAK